MRYIFFIFNFDCLIAICCIFKLQSHDLTPHPTCDAVKSAFAGALLNFWKPLRSFCSRVNNNPRWWDRLTGLHRSALLEVQGQFVSDFLNPPLFQIFWDVHNGRKGEAAHGWHNWQGKAAPKCPTPQLETQPDKAPEGWNPSGFGSDARWSRVQSF